MKEVKAEVTKFVCDNCGKENNEKNSIYKCSICGKEICRNCGVYRNIKYNKIEENENPKEDGENYIFEEYIGYNLCHECYTKLDKQRMKIMQQYWDKKDELYRKYNEESELLANKTFEEIKNIRIESLEE